MSTTPPRVSARRFTMPYGMNVSIVKILLEHGAKFDAKDKDGSTAFREAASQGALKILQIFIAKDANASALPVTACMSDMERVKAFEAHGADLNAKDELGCGQRSDRSCRVPYCQRRGCPG